MIRFKLDEPQRARVADMVERFVGEDIEPALWELVWHQDEVCRLQVALAAAERERDSATTEAANTRAHYESLLGAAVRERDEARNYVAEVAQGVTHYPHDAGEPCVRCERDDANDHIAETQEWFARHGIQCGCDGSLIVGAERLLEQRDELRALCDGLRADDALHRSEINHLRARIEGYERWEREITEALNSGDGTYRYKP